MNGEGRDLASQQKEAKLSAGTVDTEISQNNYCTIGPLNYHKAHWELLFPECETVREKVLPTDETVNILSASNNIYTS